MTKRVAIGADHAGIHLKDDLKEELTNMGCEVIDFGTNSKDAVDYPDIANRVCDAVLKGGAAYGVLMCGSGIGMSIAANRHAGIRAALCHDGLSAELSRRHNDANVLCLGARVLGPETAKRALMRFLNTEFEGGRHLFRVEKLG
jgi:ribose 5-phosphate isomerase B